MPRSYDANIGGMAVLFIVGVGAAIALALAMLLAVLVVISAFVAVLAGDFVFWLRTRSFVWESRADVVIVLGAPLVDNKPGPLLVSRLQLAVDLRKRKTAPVMILCGGVTHGAQVSEAHAMAEWLVANGVPQMALRIDDSSYTTRQNLINARRIMDSSAFRTAIVCTTSYHMMRAIFEAKRLGIIVRAASTHAPKIKLHALGVLRETGAWVKRILQPR